MSPRMDTDFVARMNTDWNQLGKQESRKKEKKIFISLPAFLHSLLSFLIRVDPFQSVFIRGLN